MKWHHRFMDRAHLIASWSKDSRQVGAVIVRGKNRFVSEGYNGPPAGVEDDPNIDRATKLRRTIHAEMNAILFAQQDVSGCTIYVTHHPCGPCAAVIAQSGIKRVVIPDGESKLSHRWAADIVEADWIFKQVGIEVLTIKEEK